MFSSINRDLYYGWLNDTYYNVNAESEEEPEKVIMAMSKKLDLDHNRKFGDPRKLNTEGGN